MAPGNNAGIEAHSPGGVPSPGCRPTGNPETSTRRRYTRPVPQGEYLQYGGQAIIEGVMMRSPRHFAVAVRAPNGEIVLRSEPLEKTWIGRQKWLKLPFLRGTLALLDALVLGYKSLSFSSKVQLDPKYQPVREGETQQPNPNGEIEGGVENKPAPAKGVSDRVQNITVGFALIAGLAIGLFLFNYLPNLVAVLSKDRLGLQSQVHVNLVTEISKLVFFLAYIWLIAQLPDIKRVFRYHGAEHKAINTLEAEQPLELENCKKQTRLHPRCGTSFAIVVLLLGFVLFTFMPKPEIESSKVLTSIARFLVELPLLPVIAGISYEVIRFAGRMKNSVFVRLLLAPGLLTQYLTTAVPDDSQIEVALVALRAVVDAEEAEADGAKEPAGQEGVVGEASAIS